QYVAFVALRREVLHEVELGQCLLRQVEVEVGLPEIDVGVDVARPARRATDRAADPAHRGEILPRRMVGLVWGHFLESPLCVTPSVTLDVTSCLEVPAGKWVNRSFGRGADGNLARRFEVLPGRATIRCQAQACRQRRQAPVVARKVQ